MACGKRGHLGLKPVLSSFYSGCFSLAEGEKFSVSGFYKDFCSKTLANMILWLYLFWYFMLCEAGGFFVSCQRGGGGF